MAVHNPVSMAAQALSARYEGRSGRSGITERRGNMSRTRERCAELGKGGTSGRVEPLPDPGNQAPERAKDTVPKRG